MTKQLLEKNKWINVSDQLPMVIDQPYRFQNVGQSRISIVFSEEEPLADTTEFMYEPREPAVAETVIYDGVVQVWVKSLDLDGAVVLQEVVP